MTDGGSQRRLAAIVAIDVAGYSRLMGMDEIGTLDALKAHREAVTPIVRAHDGRIVGSAGDGLLLEFPSVVKSVQSAIKVQTLMAERNQDIADDERMLFRIGINLGDVLVDGDDIFGDGVNVAARLEALATPGGICISGTVHDQVRDRLDMPFEDMGEQEVKNIARPVRVWHWSPAASDISAPATTDEPLALPDKPSIAVLPFDNMSGDPEQEFLSDGIAEDIITVLSRFHQFFVIARNSSFTYKGQAVDVKIVARELGVQYVIEGSVRRAGSRVRITAQLIDATNDRHIWAERYDRELDDIFAVQDDITERIAMAVAPEMQKTEIARARRKSIPELGVWELVSRASWHATKMTEADSAEAQSLLKKALARDPDSAFGLALLSACYVTDSFYGWHRPPAESFSMAKELAERAVSLNKEDEIAQWALASILNNSGRHREAIWRYQKAIEINPNFVLAIGALAAALIWIHEHEKGLELLQKAIRLSPKDISIPLRISMFAVHHFIEGRYEEACAWAEKTLHDNPNFPTAYRMLASAHGILGNLAKARAAYEQFDRLAPGATIATTLRAVPFAFDDDAERYAEGLRRAGMPEE